MSFNIKKNINNLLVFLIMCISFSIPFGAVYGRKILVVVVLLWMFLVTKERLLELFKTKLFLAITLFILIHIISLFWSENIDYGIKYIKNMFIYIYIPILIFSTILKEKNIEYIFMSFILGMFINEIISYLIYFDLFQTKYSSSHHYPVGFINHIMYSILVSFSALLIFYKIKTTNVKYLQIIYGIFFITMTINLIISGGRTGYIVYFGTLILLLITHYKLSLKNIIFIIMVPMALFLFSYKYNSEINNRINSVVTSLNMVIDSGNYNSSVGARLSSYAITYNILSQKENNFILGMGTGNIKQEIQAVKDRTNILHIPYYHLHNFYLESYVNAGVLSLILLLIIFYYILILKINDDEMNFIKKLFVFTILISMLSDVILSIKEGMLFFSIFVSIFIIYQNKYEIEENKYD